MVATYKSLGDQADSLRGNMGMVSKSGLPHPWLEKTISWYSSRRFLLCGIFVFLSHRVAPEQRKEVPSDTKTYLQALWVAPVEDKSRDEIYDLLVRLCHEQRLRLESHVARGWD
jgi:hypothetical protein